MDSDKKAQDQNKKFNVLTIYAPVIYTAPCIMFWMRPYTLRGEVVGGWALEFPSFLGPVKFPIPKLPDGLFKVDNFIDIAQLSAWARLRWRYGSKLMTGVVIVYSVLWIKRV